MSLNDTHAALAYSDSYVTTIHSLSPTDRVKFVSSLTGPEAEWLMYNWDTWARPSQRTPKGDWLTWLILSGRGWGKTRVGSQWILDRVKHGYRRLAIIGRTTADVRDIMVDLGPSSILKICNPREAPVYEPSKRRLTWSNGAVATLYSGDEYELLRGPAHDSIWIDELAKFEYPQDLWDMAMLGLREGPNPQVVVTTTPKPIALIKALIKDTRTHVTVGSTFENEANLSPQFIETIRQRYEGTRLGQQELYGKLIGEAEGALWKYDWIKRVTELPDMKRIVVAIDIATTSNEKSDRTGIIVAGLGVDNRGYLLADLSGVYTPDQWARKALGAYETYKASTIVAETNQGGDLIEHTLKTINRNISYKKVHASRGKITRAEPVSALYEQGRISHHGIFEEVESQMCEWVPGDDSPDNMDALVWAFTDLMVKTVATATAGTRI